MENKADIIAFLLEDTNNTWEMVIDFTKIREGGVPVEELFAYLQD